MLDLPVEGRLRRRERRHLRRLEVAEGGRRGSTTLSARERVVLYRLGAAIPPSGHVVIAGEVAEEELVMVAAGAERRRGQVAVDGTVPPSLPRALVATVNPSRSGDRLLEPADLLVLGRCAPDAAAAHLARVRAGALVAVTDCGEGGQREGLVRRVVVSRQIEGGRSVDGIYWSRVDPARQPRQSADPWVSVIIPTFDRPRYLMEALASVIRQRAVSGGFEVVVVENAPRPQLHEMIAAAGREAVVPVRHLHEPRSGLHRARHRGAVAARGAVLAYIDDDVLTPPGWLAALVAPFADPGVAIVGGPVRPQWEAGPPSWLAEIPPSFFSLLDLGEQEIELSYPNGAYGCNLAIRSEVLLEVGGFNPDAMGWDRRLFWLRGDGETGLHQKVAEAGYRVMYEPAAGLVHRMPGSRTTPAAIRRRGLLVGLSHSFTSIRKAPSDRLLRLRLVARAGRALAAAVRSAAAAAVDRSRQAPAMADAWRHAGFAAQHVLAVLRPGALRYLRRPCFFTETMP